MGVFLCVSMYVGLKCFWCSRCKNWLWSHDIWSACFWDYTLQFVWSDASGHERNQRIDKSEWGWRKLQKKKKKKVWNVNFWCMSPILPVHHRIINSRKDGRDGQLGRTHFPICCPDRTLGSRPHETQAKLFIWICHIPCTLSFYKYLILLFSNFLLCDLFI